MINYVKINGVNSNTINGLGINELPPITKPPLRVLQEEIDGRDGDITTDLGYGAYDKTITIGLFGTGYDINNIISFFNGEGTIVFSNEPDKYYKYKIVNQIDYIALQKFKSASITFHCQPFKYPTEETPLEIEYDYIEQSNVESASITQTETAPMKLSLKGNTSQTGTPTPSTPIPVNVVSGDNEVVVCGKNIWDEQWEQGFIQFNKDASNWGQNVASTTQIRSKNYIQVDNTKTYYGYLGANSVIFAIIYDENKQPIASGNYGYINITNQTFTLPANARYIRFYTIGDYGGTYNNDICINVSDTNINGHYYPYQSQTYPIYLPVENLYYMNYNDNTTSFHGTSITSTKTGFSISGTSDSTTGFTLTNRYITLQAGTYTLRLKDTSSIQIRLSKSDYSVIATIPIGSTSVSFTLSENTNVSLTLNLTNGTTYNETNEVMIERGSKANHYTEYGTTPIELCKIGDYQDYFTKNSGKNLAREEFESKYYLTGSGDNRTVANANYKISEIIEVQPNTTYTISGTFTDFADNVIRIAMFDNLPTTGSTSTKYISSASSPYTFTTDTNTKYILIWNSGGNSDTIIHKLQLELGSSQTIYEPYTNGEKVWCKYNAIGKVVLDGSETLEFDSNNLIYKEDNIRNYNAGGLVYCNYYLGTANGGSPNVNLNAWNGNSHNINIKNNSIANLNDFKTWLGTHNTSVYYVLATPYLSLIEDTTLINQLDNIQNAMSYEGTTNINQVNNDKPFLMDLKIMKEGTNEVVINNIGNYYAKPTIALEGTGITDIYLNDTEILQVDLSDTNKITINTANMEAYDPTTNLLANRKVVGSYNSMTLPSGNTTMKITGQLTSATITDYQRWL